MVDQEIFESMEEVKDLACFHHAPCVCYDGGNPMHSCRISGQFFMSEGITILQGAVTFRPKTNKCLSLTLFWQVCMTRVSSHCASEDGHRSRRQTTARERWGAECSDGDGAGGWDSVICDQPSPSATLACRQTVDFIESKDSNHRVRFQRRLGINRYLILF